MKVYVPSALRSYTGQKDEVDAHGETLGELLSALDRRYPGFRFRIIDEQDSIRPHIKIFINLEQARGLSAGLRADDEVSILLALSGGSGTDLIETNQTDEFVVRRSGGRLYELPPKGRTANSFRATIKRNVRVGGLLILLSACVFAQGHPEMAKLGWMSGCWKANGNVQSEEHWTKLEGQSMLGMGRTVANGKTVFYEFLQIRERVDGIFYIAQPNGATAVSFKLVKINDNEAVFENLQHDFPQRITYQRTIDGSLLAITEGDEKGKPKRVEFVMKRARCD